MKAGIANNEIMIELKIYGVGRKERKRMAPGELMLMLTEAWHPLEGTGAKAQYFAYETFPAKYGVLYPQIIIKG